MTMCAARTLPVMTTPSDPLLTLDEIRADLFPDSSASTVREWAAKGLLGPHAVKVRRNRVWLRSSVVKHAIRAGKLTPDGRPAVGGRGDHLRLPPAEQLRDVDGERLLTVEDLLSLFGVPEQRSRETVIKRWIGQCVRRFPERSKMIGRHRVWREDVIRAWAEREGVEVQW